MKIEFIIIVKYKNLENCRIDFNDSDGLVVVAGINGSGKSNLLEAVALIFMDLKHEDLPSELEKPEYVISYIANGQRHEIRHTRGEDRQTYLPSGEVNDLSYSAIEDTRLIAMYSGEFNRLSNRGFTGSFGFASSNSTLFVSPQSLLLSFLGLWLTNSLQSDVGTGSFRFRYSPTYLLFRMRDTFAIDPETGPEDEIDDLVLKLIQMAEPEDGLYKVEMNSLKSAFESVGAVNSRDVTTVLERLISTDEYSVGYFSECDICLKTEGGAELSLEDLSEGEKRILLLRNVYEVLAGDNAVLLLDEPDAHIHESWKIDLYNYLRNKSRSGILTVCTSHSPTFVNKVDERSLVGLRNADGGMVEVVSQNELSVLRSLSDDRMNLFSFRPMLFFEGKSDVTLFRQAIHAFRVSNADYADLTIDSDFDFFIIGGAGDAKWIYTEYRKLFPRRLIYMVFDQDKAGRDALAQVTLPDASNQQFIPLADISQGVQQAAGCLGGAICLPRPEGVVTLTDWTIEEYIAGDYIASTVRGMVDGYSRFHTVGNVKKELKTKLGSDRSQLPPNALMGFKPLIDLVRSLPLS